MGVGKLRYENTRHDQITNTVLVYEYTYLDLSVHVCMYIYTHLGTGKSGCENTSHDRITNTVLFFRYTYLDLYVRVCIYIYVHTYI